MKTLALLSLFFLILVGCGGQNRTVADGKSAATSNDTVRIANDELQYEVIIIDPGFNTWLTTRARPRNFYTQSYMETRNRVWVNEWNNRSRIPSGRNLFDSPINYDSTVDYGYEVNYLLFNYLTYFQLKNNIRLGSFEPRI